MPLFAAVGAMVLGASGAAAAGAGVTALVGGIATAATVAGVGSAIYGSVTAGAAAKKAANANANPSGLSNPATTVDASSTSNINNLGRAALISTSPQGVQGTDPTLRYRLLGNSAGLGNS